MHENAIRNGWHFLLQKRKLYYLKVKCSQMILSAPKLLLLLFLFIAGFTPSLSAQINFENQWNKVEKLARKNKPGAAFEEARSIYESARSAGADIQAARALLYMSGLYSDNATKNRSFSINQLEKELIRAKGITRSVLQSMLAESYWEYWKSVRYRYYSRPDTVSLREYDLNTWNASDYHRKISELFMASIEDEKTLQQTKPEAILPLLESGNARMLRPTLFDLLAFRAFNYFKDDERDIKSPAYRLDLGAAEAFAPLNVFIEKLNYKQDTSHAQHRALLILRKLISFHLNDTEKAALIDADIHRLNFVYHHNLHPDKETLYVEALNRMRRDYGDHPAAAVASYYRAQLLADKGNKWRPFENDTFRFEKVKAKLIADSILLQERMSEGKNACMNLLLQMQWPDLNFEMEQVNVPANPFRIRVSYKNIPQLHLRVVSFNDKFLNSEYPNSLTNAVCTANPVREWQQALPATEDMQTHSAEIKVDGLAPGKYVLLMADKPTFADSKTTVAGQTFYVSSIAIVREDKDIFLLDRETGRPLGNAMAQVWEKYNVNGAWVNEKGNTYMSDSNGYFRIAYKSAKAAGTGVIPLALDIHHKDESIFVDVQGNSYSSYSYRRRPYYQPKPLTDTSLFIFTDRSIYRPGQTVYFKAIALYKDSTGRKGGVVPGTTYSISLVNSNRETVSVQQLETNEFGAISGSFRLPANGLNGNYFLRHDYWAEGAQIKVEEYKRPTFTAIIDPVKGKYLLNDSVTITGAAKAYAGYPVSGARVNYKVVRRARFLYDWYWRSHTLPYSRDADITMGETITDDAGKFSFRFEAEPDTSVARASEPVFDYFIETDVTDLNGEVHTATDLVSVSYQPFILKTSLKGSVPLAQLPQSKVEAQNLSGEPVAVPLTISFIRVQDENRLMRERYWNRTDQFTMSKTEYLRYFPYDEYDNESEPSNRPLSNPETVVQITSSPEGKWASAQQLSKLSPGHYLLTISAPGTGNSIISEKKYIELYDADKAASGAPVYWFNSEGGSIETGDSLKLTVATSADNCFIIQQTAHGSPQLLPQTTDYRFLDLTNEKKQLVFKANPSDQGGYGVSWTFVKHNRIFTTTTTMQVPWSSKNLHLEYASFRDKTSPGSNEQWKIIVKGNGNEKVAAEMMASMYDASLDELYMHNWSKPFLWGNYLHTRQWIGAGFTKLYGLPVREPALSLNNFIKEYDALLCSFVFAPDFFERKSTEPLWWINPLQYMYDDTRNPRLMRLPKPVLPDSDGDGVTDQYDMEQTPTGCPVDSRGVSLDSDGDGIPDCKDTDADPGKEEPVKARTNFNETAFFYPHLHTDSTGAVSIEFTMPESLTRWKFQALAHTKDLSFGYSQQSLITQKTFMVVPNAPRFLREKDKIVLSAKLVNLTDSLLKGQARLELLDEETGQVLDGQFRLLLNKQPVLLAGSKSTVVNFPVEVPAGFTKPLTWRITARVSSDNGEKYNDGEQNTLPVLSGRMMITESLPLYINEPGTKKFQFPSLLNSGKSNTLSHYAITTEYTGNPVWYAMQSLPYLMEYPYECAEQTWNRFYANVLAGALVGSSPLFQTVFKEWAREDSLQVAPPLEKNPELKSMLLEETPWVNEAATETAQKRKLVRLYNTERTKAEMEKTWGRLQQLQNPSGAFAWFKGGTDNTFITQYIVSGIGHLKKLLNNISPDTWSGKIARKMDRVAGKATTWLDNEIKQDYEQIKSDNKGEIRFRPGYYDIQRLYARSFFPELSNNITLLKAINLYTEQATAHWTTYNNYIQAMIVLINYRKGDKETAGKLLASLKQRSVSDEQTGMYWPDSLMSKRYFWYEAPVETQSLLIEAFLEAGADTLSANAMRTWLLRQKQTNSWSNTKATAEACYAILLPDKSILSAQQDITLTLGPTTYRSSELKKDAGTGYFKIKTPAPLINSAMGNITLTAKAIDNSAFQPSWGAIHWQYFEDMDKLGDASSGSLKLVKKIFVERAEGKNRIRVPVTATTSIRTGEKIIVQLFIQSNRDMEFVHLRDQRAAALEPTNMLSGYTRYGNLICYQTSRDASTDFFIENIPKGNYQIEYILFATHSGQYNNGLATIQCMYAPELNARSESLRIKVE